jgi:hypothetical protein
MGVVEQRLGCALWLGPEHDSLAAAIRPRVQHRRHDPRIAQIPSGLVVWHRGLHTKAFRKI